MILAVLATFFGSAPPALPVPGPPLERFEYRKVIMGVEARLLLHAEGEPQARRAAEAAFGRMTELDQALSDYKADSELNRAVAGASSRPVALSEDLYRVLEASQELSGRSGGAFDITVKPLVLLWSDSLAADHEPEPGLLEAAREFVGFKKLRLADDEHTLFLSRPGMALDLGGIGKGYACDEALKVLEQHGIESALVDLGGDLVLGAPPPGRAGWTVQAGCGERQTLLTLSRVAVATSGETEQHHDLNGVRYSHIIDPRVGRPLTDSSCVSVVAKDGMTADGLASAASVLGLEAAERLCSSYQGAWLMFDDPRFVSLFDGKSLDGWVESGGRYDGNARWSVEDGALCGRVGEDNGGGLIYTAGKYTCFELELDSFIDYPFDSGIFLRMAPEKKGMQVTIDDREGGEIGAIYSDGFLQHNEAAEERYLRGEWNHFQVRLTGFDMHVQVWMNGGLICDYQLPEKSEGYAPTGLIGLQVHGGREDPQGNRARFKNIRIRELPIFGTDPDRFEPLFSGWGLDRFEPPLDAAGYRQLYEILEFMNNGEGGDLRTRDDFRDFRLRLDFMPSRMANSGVFLRAARDAENPAYSGCEIQILDDFNWEQVTGTELKEWQFCGSLYGSVAPAVHALRPIGEWNTYEILYRGSRLAVALNGQVLYDVDTFKVPGQPFSERAREGFIGLQRTITPDVDDDASIRFREIWVERLGND
ncbi:MAG: family 16 glycoside hydrolase [Planctomycetota bacterium]